MLTDNQINLLKTKLKKDFGKYFNNQRDLARFVDQINQELTIKKFNSDELLTDFIAEKINEFKKAKYIK